jgi:hypothetical protein
MFFCIALKWTANVVLWLLVMAKATILTIRYCQNWLLKAGNGYCWCVLRVVVEQWQHSKTV